MSLIAKNIPPFPKYDLPDLSPKVQVYFRDVAVYVEKYLREHDVNLGPEGLNPGHVHEWSQPYMFHATTHEASGTDLISHDDLTDFVTGEHYNHTAISIIAGTNLNGGGAITANRTLNLDASPSVTSLIAGTLTVAAGSITDSSGAISFGNENLSTTGSLTVAGAFGVGCLFVRLTDTETPAYGLRLQSENTGITADRAITFDVGNVNRLLTLSGNPTLADWFDQSVKTTANVIFNQVVIVDETKTLINLVDDDLFISNLQEGGDIQLGTDDGSVIINDPLIVLGDIGIGVAPSYTFHALDQSSSNSLVIMARVEGNSGYIDFYDDDRTGFERVLLAVTCNAEQATFPVFGSNVAGESFSRFSFTGTGKLVWGNGAATWDTNLYRDSAGTLKTDNDFIVTGNISVGNGISSIASGRYGLFFSGNDVALVNRATNGTVQIRANTVTAGAGGEVTVGIFEDDEIQLLPSGGNVGIGTANPAFGKLEVYGNGADTILAIHEDAGTHKAQLHLRSGGGDTKLYSLGNNFYIDTESLAQALTILAAGNVGIGTPTPTAALQMGDDKLLAVDTNAGITASITQTQGDGALTAQVNEISTVANKDDNVTLPTAVTGIEIEIINNGANTLLIFPASGDNLGLGVNTGEELEANERVKFVAYDTTNWAKESTTEIIHAEIHDEDNTDAFVINDAGADFHSYHTNGLAAGDLADWIFDAGGAGTSFPIASIADGADSGVDIAVTTTGLHGLEVGDIISQTNLANAAYVGIFDVKAIISTTIYEVAAVYTATGTGTMDQAATLEADAVAAGVYAFAYYISGTLVGNNETFDFQLHKEATVVTGSKIRRKFGAANDFGSMSGGGVVSIVSGDKISFALSNENSAANIILRNLTIVLIRL